VWNMEWQPCKQCFTHRGILRGNLMDYSGPLDKLMCQINQPDDGQNRGSLRPKPE
jgi:hypothetical protein